MNADLRRLLHEAADALRTLGHDRSGHNLMAPSECFICDRNALADRLDAAGDSDATR